MRAKSSELLVSELVDAGLIEALDPAYLGPHRWIFCYRALDGAAPAREFLAGLRPAARAGYLHYFTSHCQGHTLRGEKWRIWTERGCDGLFEYKHIPSKTRLMHITDVGHTHILLFGFGGKKENKTATVHVLRARRMRDEYLRRRDALLTRKLKGGRS